MEQTLNKSKISVREISKKIAKDMIVKHHYSHTWTMCRYALGIFYETDNQHSFFDETEEKLAGVASWNGVKGKSQYVHTLLNKGEQFNPEFKKISPFSKIPVIKDLPVGKTLSDHAGILGLLYNKNHTQSRNIEEVEYTLNIEFMQNIYEAFPDDNKKLLYIVDGINVPSQYKNSVVFDFTKWAKLHPGRENAIKKWATDEKKKLSNL